MVVSKPRDPLGLADFTNPTAIALGAVQGGRTGRSAGTGAARSRLRRGHGSQRGLDGAGRDGMASIDSSSNADPSAGRSVVAADTGPTGPALEGVRAGAEWGLSGRGGSPTRHERRPPPAPGQRAMHST